MGLSKQDIMRREDAMRAKKQKLKFVPLHRHTFISVILFIFKEPQYLRVEDPIVGEESAEECR